MRYFIIFIVIQTYNLDSTFRWTRSNFKNVAWV